jgi:hypothetical protein
LLIFKKLFPAKYLRGSARNLSGQYKIEKDRLLNIVEILDCKLDAQERHTMRKANADLAKLRREEESKWDERAKVVEREFSN